MKFQQFLAHHGIARNPFAEEDAQTDPVFKDHCIVSTFHPTWDKIYGDPTEPATSIVFGEKGSGKTAMRLQISRHLEQFNARDSGRGLFVVHYDDFNPFLDRFRERLPRRRRRSDRMLQEWRLWDHMDAILSLAVTSLVDGILEVGAGRAGGVAVDPGAVDRLDRYLSRDLLLLAAFYDQSTAETARHRWHRLRRRLRYSSWTGRWDLWLGWASLPLWLLTLGILIGNGFGSWLLSWWYLPLAAGLAPWLPWLGRYVTCFRKARAVVRNQRVGNHEAGTLRNLLMQFGRAALESQPMPAKDSTDDRYALLAKLQAVLETLGYRGLIVLVDRVDEPHLINGSAERMKALLWPLLDNKFLKHPGLGLKLMLPIELSRFVDREDREFFQRARLDKQNVVRSFEWTAEALYDVANARLQACSEHGCQPTLRQMFSAEVSDQRLLSAFQSLRVPRHLFKFMYRVCVAHCNAHTDDAPAWTISANTFESMLSVYQRDQDALDRGVGSG